MTDPQVPFTPLTPDDVARLEPAERLAFTVAAGQVARDMNPGINTTAALLLAIQRLIAEPADGPERDRITELEHRIGQATMMAESIALEGGVARACALRFLGALEVPVAEWPVAPEAAVADAAAPGDRTLVAPVTGTRGATAATWNARATRRRTRSRAVLAALGHGLGRMQGCRLEARCIQLMPAMGSRAPCGAVPDCERGRRQSLTRARRPGRPRGS